MVVVHVWSRESLSLASRQVLFTIGIVFKSWFVKTKRCEQDSLNWDRANWWPWSRGGHAFQSGVCGNSSRRRRLLAGISCSSIVAFWVSILSADKLGVLNLLQWVHFLVERWLHKPSRLWWYCAGIGGNVFDVYLYQRSYSAMIIHIIQHKNTSNHDADAIC
jgi:hypothetical protein